MVVWKQVTEVGFGHYEVSNLGKVRRTKGQRKYKEMKGTKNNKGYIQVGLQNKDGKQFHQSVHRLVLGAFQPLEQPNMYTMVDHINGNKTDNRLENLRWSNYVLNNMNRTKAKCYNKHGNSWQVQVKLWGKAHSFGTYKTEEEAASVAKKAKETMYNIAFQWYEEQNAKLREVGKLFGDFKKNRNKIFAFFLKRKTTKETIYYEL